MDMKISSIDLDLLNFKQISVFNQRAATPSHSVPSLPKIGKMHQYEIHITTGVFFWLSSSADRQQQVFSLKAERRRITSWLSSWQVASFFLSVKKGTCPSSCICQSICPTVSPNREDSLASESEEEDEDHDHDGDQHADSTPLSATWRTHRSLDTLHSCWHWWTWIINTLIVVCF